MTCALGPSRRQGVQGPAADMNNIHTIYLQACVNIVSIADCGPHFTYLSVMPQIWQYQMYASRLVGHMPHAAPSARDEGMYGCRQAST